MGFDFGSPTGCKAVLVSTRTLEMYSERSIMGCAARVPDHKSGPFTWASELAIKLSNSILTMFKGREGGFTRGSASISRINAPPIVPCPNHFRWDLVTDSNSQTMHYKPVSKSAVREWD
jgi:hypothetical protein